MESKGKELFGKHFNIHNQDRELLFKLLIYIIRDKENAERLNIQLNKGILLSGPVGCGKTSLMNILRFFLPIDSRYVMKSCRDVSLEFIREGYEVIIPSRKELNLLDNQSIENYIEKHKNLVIDVIINNAGINPLAFIEDITDKDFDETIQINLKAPYKIIQGFVPKMKEQKYGKIINISSIWGVVSKEKRTIYSATKNGIHGITNSLAVELGKDNILVNSVCPGYTNTELTKQNVSEEEN